VTRIKIAVWYFLIGSNAACAAVQNTARIDYAISAYGGRAPGKIPKQISIEKVVLKPTSVVGAVQAEKISVALNAMAEEFYEEAAACKDPVLGNPWSYQVKLEQAHLIDGVLSIVFSSATVCYGNPGMEKISKNFNVDTGAAVKIGTLVQKYAPSLLDDGKVVKGDFLKLGADGVELLMAGNPKLINEQNKPQCQSYLREAAYRVWVGKSALILQPFFRQALSSCYGEYSIRFEQSK
jgi:hypothetical protein